MTLTVTSAVTLPRQILSPAEWRGSRLPAIPRRGFRSAEGDEPVSSEESARAAKKGPARDSSGRFVKARPAATQRAVPASSDSGTSSGKVTAKLEEQDTRRSTGDAGRSAPREEAAQPSWRPPRAGRGGVGVHNVADAVNARLTSGDTSGRAGAGVSASSTPRGERRADVAASRTGHPEEVSLDGHDSELPWLAEAPGSETPPPAAAPIPLPADMIEPPRRTRPQTDPQPTPSYGTPSYDPSGRSPGAQPSSGAPPPVPSSVARSSGASSVARSAGASSVARSSGASSAGRSPIGGAVAPSPGIPVPSAGEPHVDARAVGRVADQPGSGQVRGNSPPGGGPPTDPAPGGPPQGGAARRWFARGATAGDPRRGRGAVGDAVPRAAASGAAATGATVSGAAGVPGAGVSGAAGVPGVG